MRLSCQIWTNQTDASQNHINHYCWLHKRCYRMVQCLFLCNLKKNLSEKTRKNLQTKHSCQRSLVRHLYLQFAVARGSCRTVVWIIGSCKAASMLPCKITVTRT